MWLGRNIIIVEDTTLLSLSQICGELQERNQHHKKKEKGCKQSHQLKIWIEKSSGILVEYDRVETGSLRRKILEGAKILCASFSLQNNEKSKDVRKHADSVFSMSQWARFQEYSKASFVEDVVDTTIWGYNITVYVSLRRPVSSLVCTLLSILSNCHLY